VQGKRVQGENVLRRREEGTSKYAGPAAPFRGRTMEEFLFLHPPPQISGIMFANLAGYCTQFCIPGLSKAFFEVGGVGLTFPPSYKHESVLFFALFNVYVLLVQTSMNT
jgi:hypothetical protein